MDLDSMTEELDYREKRFYAKTSLIAARLRDLADSIERIRPYERTDMSSLDYVNAAYRVQHEIAWALPNMDIHALAGLGAEIADLQTKIAAATATEEEVG